MSEKPKQLYLGDPHLFYHLESPVKIMHLLESGLFYLQQNCLVSKESKEIFPITNFTIRKIPKDALEKHTKQVPPIQMVSENKMRGERWKSVDDVLENTELKLTSRSPHKLLNKTSKFQNSKDVKFVNQMNKKIKGLKEFQKKIL